MSCLFCAIAAGSEPASIVWQDESCVAFMDLFPVSDGHVLVIPRTHAAHIGELAPPLRAHLLEIACRVMTAQAAAGIRCDANNLLVNDGKAANQHVPHVHLHVIPRRHGDGRSTLWRFATRLLNRRDLDERRRRLDAMAARLGAAMQEG